MKQWINDRALAAKVWWRDRKERAEVKREQLPAHAAPLLWCVLLTMVGVAALAGSTWMLLIFIAGSVGHVDWTSTYAATEAGVTTNQWAFDMSVHWTVAIGLFLFCCAIAIFNATWLEARKHLHGAIRNVVTAIGVVVALFMISGAIVVQQRGTDARARDDVVAAQTAQVGAATAQARLTRAETRLREMRNHENQYMAVAATVGAAEFERSYLSPEQRARETPDRLRLLERSLGAARQADALEAEIAQIQGEVAAAQTTAVAAEAVSVRAEGFMAGPVAILEDARKPLTATLGELLALTAFGFALAAWRSRRVTLEQSGWADAAHRIEDLRADEPVVAQPMRPAETQLRNADTQETIIDKDGDLATIVKEHTRKKRGKDGKPVRVMVPVDGLQVQYEGVGFTARDVVEKDGRSERLAADEAAHDSEVNQPIADADNHEANNEADKAPAPQADDSEPSIEPVHPEPSETAPADLDAINTLATLNSADEPEQHSTDDRADDAPAEEVSQPAIVAHEADALAEDEDVFHDEPARETRPERLLAAAK